MSDILLAVGLPIGLFIVVLVEYHKYYRQQKTMEVEQASN